MDVSIVAFAPEHLDAVARFNDEYFERPRTADFLRWRYLDSLQFGPTILALGGGRVLAMVCSLRKTFLLHGRSVEFLEVFDWHCLPELKGAGVGLRVMRAMMRLAPPVLAIGGTADVLSALPAMGWRPIGATRLFQLPLSGAALGEALQNRAGIPAAVTSRPLDPLARSWFRPRRARPPQGGMALPVGGLGTEALALYDGDTGYDFVQRVSPDLLRWITAGYAGNGHFTPLYFTIDGRLRGWALTRVYIGDSGRLEAALLDIFAPLPDAGLYTWMVSEAVAALAAFRPQRIWARASCPELKEALARNRFREEPASVPLHLWWPGESASWTRIHVTLNHTDEPLRPYPEERAATRFLRG